MSLARIKQVLTHLEEAKDVVFQIVQMNTSRNGDTAYIVRPVTFEPIDKMKSFLLEIHDKYLDSKKGLDKMFSACIAYDGSADGKNVYYLETDNALIQKEYDLLLEALAAPAVEQDPLLMKAIASMITFSIEDDGEILPVKLISMQNPITTLKHKFFCNKGRFEEFSEKVLNLRTSIDVIIVGDKVYFLTMAGEKLFNMERAYKKLCADYVVAIKDSGIIVNVDGFTDVALHGHNPRRFVAYNKKNLEQLQNSSTRERIAKLFSVKLTDGKLDATDPKDAERIVKILCNKGMTDPFREEAMEVSGARKWS